MATTKPDLPVLIVGGGIGGLAAAYALALKGYPSIVLEQAPEFAEIGAGIQLGPNVFRMFDRLGIRGPIMELAVLPETLVMRDAITAEEVTSIPAGSPFLDRFGYPYAVIHRADLHRVLLEVCKTSNLIQLRTNAKVTAVADKGSHAALTLDTDETIEGAALIGADGLWSMVRQHIVGDGRPRISGHIAYRAVLPTTEMPAELRWQSMVLWAGEKRHLVHYPLRTGQLFNLVAVFHSNRFTEGWNDYGDAEELQERFQGSCPAVETLLAKIESWRMWVLCDRDPVKNWSQGRLTLLGDAAHPTLQYLAQGACMAIEDAVCLADRAEKHQGDFAAAFLDYQEARYLRTARVQLTARLYGEVYHASGVARELRNVTLASRTPAQAFEAMSWLYDFEG